MAHYFVFADKDATLERGADVEGTASAKNTGMDEILEIGKVFKTDSNVAIGSTSRTVISFPTTVISQSVADGTFPAGTSYYLNLYDAGSVNLNRDQTLYAYTISQSWSEGDGKKSDLPNTTNGVSWRYRTEVTSSEWNASAIHWGATYFSGSLDTASQSFNKDESVDMRMDVTSIVNNWVSGGIDNEGFLIKRSDGDESNLEKFGMFKFFSSDTHTVFRPKLEVVWDDAVWTTGSLSALTSDNLDKLAVYMENFRPEYKLGSLSKIRVKGREQFPGKTFATSSVYRDVKYMPSASSCYSIVDSKTADTIVPFGSGSKLSCDTSGNYFTLRTQGLEPERFYRILFRVETGSGINKIVNFYDNDDSFKVVR